MKRNSKPITRSDLVDLVHNIKDSLKPEFAKVNRRLDRIEKLLSHTRNSLKRAGRILTDV